MPLSLPTVSKVIAIASGKGGVGKTTVTVNLALALAQSGARVGLFDADVYGPNVPLMLGVHRKQGTQAYVPIVRADSTPYIEPTFRYGLRMMSFGLLVGEKDTVLSDPPLIGRMVSQTLRDVIWGALDYLLIDFPPGSGEPQHSLLRTVHIDGALLVTTPQDLSLLDVGRSLGMFRAANVPILGVVENMSYLTCPHCGERVEVFHHSERDWAIQAGALEVLGDIPMDLAISRGIDTGHPLLQAHPTGPQADAFRR
ncbi:MAG: Mrp/NBP35 family ATP-binding protein, partial [Chloroflexota bacterium]|nr:Mrp/NBP35 family ATP-binding protein [Chloroflexota bacterium]